MLEAHVINFYVLLMLCMNFFALLFLLISILFLRKLAINIVSCSDALDSCFVIILSRILLNVGLSVMLHMAVCG